MIFHDKFGHEMALRVFRKWVKPGHNAIISPLGLNALLVALFEGSQGAIRTSAAQYLKYSHSEEHFGSVVSDTVQKLSKDPGLQMTWAHSIWTPYKPTQTYQSEVPKRYGVEVHSCDFNTPAFGSRAINDWVSKTTQRKILNVSKPSDVAHSHIVMLSALDIKSFWQQGFDAQLSKTGNFHRGDGKLRTQFMHQSTKAGYYENEQVQVLELPFQGAKTSMIFILPKPGLALYELQKGMTAENLEQCLSLIKQVNVQVSLPLFTIEWGVEDLKEDFINTGMPKRGDFSGLGAKDIEVNRVLHKLRIEVSESGASVTNSLGMDNQPQVISESNMTHQFLADRPFLFLVRERTSSAWLILGQVETPEWNVL